MLSTVSLLNQLQSSYPQFTFSEGDDFHWDHNSSTIFYPPHSTDTSWPPHLLHELAHAMLNHHSYTRDIELIAKERDAWSYARTELAPTYKITIKQEVIDSAMDSYRNWLHARSTCPTCEATGFEIHKNTYRCLACREQWHVNEARICNLRRYRIQK